MTRSIASIIALLSMFGAVGTPLAAYDCDDCGEAGTVSVLSLSAGSCYADTCCESDEATAGEFNEGDTPCCDMDVSAALDNSRALPPDAKPIKAGPSATTPVRCDASLFELLAPSLFSSVSNLRPPLNLPLLI